MAIDSSAFERYRHSPNEKTTILRLILGVIIIVVLWFGTTMAVIFAGSYGLLLQGPADSSGGSDPIQRFLGSSTGIFATLVTFAGIWIGIWIAMRLLHKEKLSRLFGVSARISRSGFIRGFAAVVVTSLVTEIAYLSVMPGISRGPIAIGTWALIFLPLAFFAFIQTSAEELLFRGYLQRGLAFLFRSPIVWAVLPTLVFTALHWNPVSPIGMNIGVMIAIGAFSALLALLVYATGNLGAAMGAHLGNNLTGFALISHDQTLGGLALFQAPPLDSLAWTSGETALIAGISLVSIGLTWLLLLHPRSPLRVRPDLG
ncbi:CPBP family intramembrane glutamic endopeptidase [Mesorhizobium sp. VNQ89]|uniref:CPBP family intramembrane glutamic endopeptidase n=1 Tax=Mesorhizobium quangtriensis TaxID=3157709 RepID=UPI0032B7FDAE